MGNLSTYRAGGSPVGSVQMFHEAVASNSLIVDSGKEYLKSGEYVPYQAKYATAAARGLSLTGSGGFFGNAQCTTTFGSGNSTVVGPSELKWWPTWANGAMHIMHQVTADTAQQGESVTFSINRANGDTYDSPRLIVTPTITQFGFEKFHPSPSGRYISAPFYLNTCNRWAVVFYAYSVTEGTTTFTVDFHLATSVDGVNWEYGGYLTWSNFGGVVAESAVTAMHITAGAAGNIVSVIAGISNSSTNYPICFSFSVDSFGHLQNIIRPANWLLGGGTTNASFVSQGSLFMTTIGPTSLLTFRGDNSAAVYSLYIVDDSVQDAFVANPDALELPGIYSGSFLNNSNQHKAGICVNNTAVALFGVASGTRAVVIIPNISVPKTRTNISDTNDFLANVGPWMYPSGSNFIYLRLASATTLATNRITPAGASTALTNGTTDALYPTGERHYERFGTNLSFDNHIYLPMSGVDRILNVNTNATSDFTLTSTAGVIISNVVTSMILADTGNVILVHGADGADRFGGISKASLSNLNRKDLKYVDAVPNSTVWYGGVLKRLSDPSSTIVFISRNTNTLLSSTNNGDSWNANIVSGVSVIHDVDYISGRFVVVGTTTGTNNFAHGTAIGSWTNGVINSTATSVYRLFNTGTSLITVNNSGVNYRTTTGSTFTACSGTSSANTSNNASYAKNGSTHYIFTPFNTSGRVNFQTSTDDGATWSTTTVSASLASLPAGAVPVFVQSGSKWYSTPLTTLNLGEVEIYETTDLITFTRHPLIFPMQIGSTTYSGLFLVGTTVYAFTNAYISEQLYTAPTIYKINAGTPTYIGTPTTIRDKNQVGYVRIK